MGPLIKPHTRWIRLEEAGNYDRTSLLINTVKSFIEQAQRLRRVGAAIRRPYVSNKITSCKIITGGQSYKNF